MFDCSNFLKRKRWDQTTLAKKLGCTQSAVSMWSCGSSTPTYEMVLKLIGLGATAEELFGKNYSEVLVRNSVEYGSFENILKYNNEFEHRVVSVVLDLKDKGII